MKLLQTDIKNKVLQSMMTILDRKREAIIAANTNRLLKKLLRQDLNCGRAANI